MGDRDCPDWACGAILSEDNCEPEGRYVQDSLAECCRLAMTHRKVLISLEPWHAHLPSVLGAVRIALQRAEVRWSIPRTSIQRADEGYVDIKHAEDLPQHLACM